MKTDEFDTRPVELIEVIRTTLTLAGSGKSKDDPTRRVIQFWSTDGDLLAEVDDLGPTHCNAIGHVVWPGEDECRRCAAKFNQRRDGKMP